jgi:hypothetical protein
MQFSFPKTFGSDTQSVRENILAGFVPLLQALARVLPVLRMNIRGLPAGPGLFANGTALSKHKESENALRLQREDLNAIRKQG